MPTVTINAVEYPTYDTLAKTVEYLAASLFAVKWAEGDNNFKSQVMVMATRYLDAIPWKGTKTDEAQLIEWPRINTGVASAPVDGSIPPAILYGFYEACALIAEDPSLVQAENSGSNVQRAKGGEAEVWFFKSTFETAGRLPPIVHNWVKAYYLAEVGAYSLATGIPDEPFVSIFDDQPGRIGGLY